MFSWNHICSASVNRIAFRWQALAFGLLLALSGAAQTSTIRYNDIVKGGVAMIGNSHYLQSSDFDVPDPSIVNDVDGDVSTSISTSADLILPANSSIVFAYLAVETGFESTPGDMTSVKFRVPGGSYITLTSASSQFLVARSVNDPGTRKYRQMTFDVTDLIPSSGYVSDAAGGAAGRYFLADPIPNYPVDQRTNMGGWSLIVVYRNPNSINRSVVVADNWRFFDSAGESVDTDIPNVRMPNSGSVAATVGITGTYGDPVLAGYCPGCNDYLSFGIAGGALSDLTDPVSGTASDALNSSIGWTASNDVSTDGGPAISGSYASRLPATVFTPANYAPTGSMGSADYDSDIFAANGILPADGSLRTVRLRQRSTGSDWLVSGSYFISVETVVANLELGLAPSTIIDGGTATYTYTINNSFAGAIDHTGLTFTNTLPTGIVIAAIPNVTISCGGSVTALPGSNQVVISGVGLTIGQNCIITVNVTNATGQLNGDCASLPSAFTNGPGNFTSSSNLSTSVAAVCLEVIPDPCDAAESGNADNDGDNNSDVCDLDDDNDGIPDAQEMDQCAGPYGKSGTWVTAGSGASTTWSTTAGTVGITATASGYGAGLGFTLNDFTVDALGCNGAAFSDPTMVGNASLSIRHTYPGSETITFNFDQAVLDPILHLDRLGGGSGPGGTTTSSLLEIVTAGVTFTELAANDIHFETTSTTVTRTSGVVYNALLAECGPPLDGNATGSVRLNGYFSSITLRVSMNSLGSPITNDRFEIAFSNVRPAADCDQDGVANHLDLDSDNDGIYDCVESGSALPFTNGVLNGAINPNGIPIAADINGDGTIYYTLSDSDSDGIRDFTELDGDSDGCFDVIEAGYTDMNSDGELGPLPLTVDGNGVVTSGGP